MALSNARILQYKKAGKIIIDPFKKENLSTSSYDVTLGEWYFREQRPRDDDVVGRSVYNIYDKAHTDAVWGTEPRRARRAKEVLPEGERVGIKENDRVIILRPGETVLAHTREFIGGRESVTTMMKARSSLGRNFIEVCKCAGWGDVGYVSRWTMEITNNSSHHTIPLVVGRRIAQIIFFETGEVLAEDDDYSRKGKYQTEDDIARIKKTWKPEMMLPKMYMDREARQARGEI